MISVVSDKRVYPWENTMHVLGRRLTYGERLDQMGLGN